MSCTCDERLEEWKDRALALDVQNKMLKAAAVRATELYNSAVKISETHIDRLRIEKEETARLRKLVAMLAEELMLSEDKTVLRNMWRYCHE